MLARARIILEDVTRNRFFFSIFGRAIHSYSFSLWTTRKLSLITKLFLTGRQKWILFSENEAVQNEFPKFFVEDCSRSKGTKAGERVMLAVYETPSTSKSLDDCRVSSVKRGTVSLFGVGCFFYCRISCLAYVSSSTTIIGIERLNLYVQGWQL